MKNIFAMHANAEQMFALAKSLTERPRNLPGMGLVYGDPGEGKTRAACRIADLEGRRLGKDAAPIFIRALANDTPRSFLEALVLELGHAPLFRTSDLYRQAETILLERPRLLIVDEIDHLAANWRAIETLRDLTDRTSVPILMIGMTDSERKLARFRHFYYRLKAHILQFKPLTEQDTQRFVEQMAEVALDESAIQFIHDVSGGRIGEILPEILKAERLAQANDLKTIKATHLMRRAA